MQEECFNRRPTGFAEDYFLAEAMDSCALIDATMVERCIAPPKETLEAATVPVRERFPEWLRYLQAGFAVLLHGVGSKRRLLQDFKAEQLKPWGAVCVDIDGFDGRFSLCDCLRGLLEQVFPAGRTAGGGGTSLESLATAVAAAVAAAGTAEAARPLCFVVHSLDLLPQPQQAALASLAAAPLVHIIASADSIWAPLLWDPSCLKGFNFLREEVNTSTSYEVEAAARFPGGLPAWCSPGGAAQKARRSSLALVLRSLTNSHRELVQAIAEAQLGISAGAGNAAAAGQDGKATTANSTATGISQSSLLSVSSDRMIATSLPKLKGLLNELKDHEVVVQRTAPDGLGQLFYLPYSQRQLQRLVEGTPVEESGDEGAS